MHKKTKARAKATARDKRGQEMGVWLARLRQQAGLSQPELGRAVSAKLGRHFPHSNIGNWESGHNFSKSDVLPALASALGVSLDALLKVRQTAHGYVPLPDDELPPRCFPYGPS